MPTPRSSIRRRACVALTALEEPAERTFASVRRRDPRPVRPRRRVANVLEMPATELGNPVLLVIAVIPDDRLLHGLGEKIGVAKSVSEM